MMRIEGEQIVYFDCDDTLVMWISPFCEEDGCRVFADGKGYLYLHPHREHIELLKQHKANGHTVVVWSAGGEKWAHSVVQGLGLSEFVDITIGKPTWYYDDLAHDEVMPAVNRIYRKYGGEGKRK